MKKFCYLFCFLLAFSLCFVPSTLKATHADEEVILISDAYDLSQMRSNSSGSFRLGSDINLAGQTFQPIQNFSGTLDGDGHTISNFTILANGGNIGFFANTVGAKIHDVQFQDVTVTAQSDVDEYTSKIGIVCGLSQSTTFENVSVVSSSITVSMPSIQYIGCFVGHAQNGTRLKNITSDCALTIISASDKTKYVGGLVGYFENSQIYDAITSTQFNGNQSNNLYQGGAFGMLLGNKTEIKNIIIDSVSDTTQIYGIAGIISYPNDMLANQSVDYIYTTVDGEYFSNTNELNNAYTNGDIAFDVNLITADVVTSRNLKLKSFYDTTAFDTRYSWDFGNIWQIEDTVTLPYLQHFSSFSYSVDKDRSFSSMAQAPSVDAITILPSPNTFTYGSSITIAGYINTQSQMNSFFEIVGLRKDNNTIYSNADILNIVGSEDAEVVEIDNNTTTYTLGSSTVTKTIGTVNNNAGTWYNLNNSNISWGTYEQGGSLVSVYQINNCTAQNSGVYSFVVDAVEYDIVVRSEDAVQGLVKRGTVQNVGQEYVEDKISYGETLRYVASASNDFGFSGWAISLDDGEVFNTNLTLSILFNENLFSEDGIFSGQTLDSENTLTIYATFTKNVCDITFSFSVNGEIVDENLTTIQIVDSDGNTTTLQANDQGKFTYKKPMENSITITFMMPSDYEFESWSNNATGVLSGEQYLILQSGEEESMQIVLNFTNDDNTGAGMGYIWWIIGGSVAGILLIGLIVFLIVKKRKDNSYKNMYY